MTEYDDCPAVDAREAEEIEAEDKMSLGDWEDHLEALADDEIIYVKPTVAARYAAMAPFDNGQESQ